MARLYIVAFIDQVGAIAMMKMITHNGVNFGGRTITDIFDVIRL